MQMSSPSRPPKGCKLLQRGMAEGPAGGHYQWSNGKWAYVRPAVFEAAAAAAASPARRFAPITAEDRKAIEPFTRQLIEQCLFANHPRAPGFSWTELQFGVLEIIESLLAAESVAPFGWFGDGAENEESASHLIAFIEYAHRIHIEHHGYLDIPTMRVGRKRPRHDQLSLVEIVLEYSPSVVVVDAIRRRYNLNVGQESKTCPPLNHAIESTNYSLVIYMLAWMLQDRVFTFWTTDTVRQSVENVRMRLRWYAHEKARREARRLAGEVEDHVDDDELPDDYPDFDEDDSIVATFHRFDPVGAQNIIDLMEKVFEIESARIGHAFAQRARRAAPGAYAMSFRDVTPEVLAFAGKTPLTRWSTAMLDRLDQVVRESEQRDRQMRKRAGLPSDSPERRMRARQEEEDAFVGGFLQ